MASTPLLRNPSGRTLNCRGAGNLVQRSRFSASLGYGSCYPSKRSRLAVCRPVVFGCMASGSAAGGRKQMEIVYDPDERINRLADEVDKEAGLSRLSFFSPCKINVLLRITRKGEDGFHDLASLFHIIRALNLHRQKTGSDNFFWIHLHKNWVWFLHLQLQLVMLQLL